MLKLRFVRCLSHVAQALFDAMEMSAADARRSRWPRRNKSQSLVGAGSSAGPIRVLLGNRPLTRLVVAFAGVTIGEWGYVTALSVDAFRKDGAIAVGIVGLRLFFAAASSLMSQIFVPRRTGKRLLSQIAFARATCVAVSAVLAGLGAPLAPILVLLAADALVSAQYRPAQSALIPTLARSPKELVSSATGLSTVKTLSQAFGSVLGGVLLAVTSPSAVFGGVAVIFGLAGVITVRFKQPATMKKSQQAISNDQGDNHGTSVGAVMRETFAAIKDRFVISILVVSGLRTFVRGMWFAIAVIASIKLLHAGSTGVGLLMLAAGIGSLVAAPLSSMLVTRPRLGTPTAIALVACGLPLAAIAGVPVMDLALGLVAAWGIGMALTDVATSSLLHRLVETPVVPRVTGAIESTKLALEGLGGFLAPLLASTIGIRAALLVAAIPLPLVVISGWKTLHKVDATAGERARTLELLHGVHCLEPLDMPTLDSLVGRLVPVEVPTAGVEVVSQGDDGDGFYVIQEGSADVLVDGFTVGIVDAGASFGERALLRGVPRTATIRSRSSMQLLMLSRDDFLAGLTGQANDVCDTALPTATADWPADAESSRDDEWTRRERVKLLARLNLFSHLDTKAVEGLADRSVVDRWPEGSVVVRQGDEGDRFFVMLEGRARVSVNDVAVNELMPGDQFGEIALLHGVPRSADVVASCRIVTLSVSRDDFMSSVRSQVMLG
jgi:CRP-like cAMP-binding protein